MPLRFNPITATLDLVSIPVTVTDSSEIDLTVTNQDITAVLKTTGVSSGTYGSSTQVPTITVDNKGRLSSASNTAISLTSGSITDFNEAAQDAVGGILTDTSTIDFTYNDAGNTISAIVIDGSITNTKIASGIDASKIANGTVSNTEFQYLDGVTSSIQTQFTGKQSTSEKAVANGYAPLNSNTVVPNVNTLAGNPRLYNVLFDDFISNNNNTGSCGEMAWGVTRSGTGAGQAAAGFADAFNKAIGATSSRTGTTATGRSCISLGPSSLGTGYITIDSEWRVCIPTLATVSEDFFIGIGFGDTFTASSSNTHGIYFLYNRSSSSNWITITTAAGVSTTTTTSSVVNTSINRLGISVNLAGTSVDFKLNGTTIATHTTNIPGFLQNFTPYMKIVKKTGTTSRNLVTDYYYQEISYGSAR